VRNKSGKIKGGRKGRRKEGKERKEHFVLPSNEMEEGKGGRKWGRG
jgi:hypothetical protein